MRAFEFIRTDVGIAHLPVKLVGGVPGFLSDGNGPTHQAIEDISIMRGIPNMQVFAPADMNDLTQTLPEILASTEPCYIRYPAATPTAIERTTHAIGKAETVAPAEQVLILTYGLLVREAMIARDLLRQSGIEAGIVDVRWLKPFDAETVMPLIAEAELIVTLEDHFQTGGLYTILCEQLVERQQAATVLPFALKERWFKPGLLQSVLEYEGFTGKQIAQKIMERLEMAPSPALSLETA
jgi:transketolase